SLNNQSVRSPLPLPSSATPPPPLPSSASPPPPLLPCSPLHRLLLPFTFLSRGGNNLQAKGDGDVAQFDLQEREKEGEEGERKRKEKREVRRRMGEGHRKERRRLVAFHTEVEQICLCTALMLAGALREVEGRGRTPAGATGARIWRHLPPGRCEVRHLGNGSHSFSEGCPCHVQ
uniref:Uncharacterized protein n=1 Tax=Aegilops tauschii subsp. strangulata TaxID=200361 RepID=A0A453CDK0_AEGTS